MTPDEQKALEKGQPILYRYRDMGFSWRLDHVASVYYSGASSSGSSLYCICGDKAGWLTIEEAILVPKNATEEQIQALITILK